MPPADPLSLWTRRWNRFDKERLEIARGVAAWRVERKRSADLPPPELLRRSLDLRARTEAELGNAPGPEVARAADLTFLALVRACEGRMGQGDDPDPLKFSQSSADEVNGELETLKSAQPKRRWSKNPADHVRELASEVVPFEREKLTRDSPPSIRGALIGAARLLSDVEHDLRG